VPLSASPRAAERRGERRWAAERAERGAELPQEPLRRSPESCRRRAAPRLRASARRIGRARRAHAPRPAPRRRARAV